MSLIVDPNGIILEEDGSHESAPSDGVNLYATSDGWKTRSAKDGRELQLGQIFPEYCRMWSDELHLKTSVSVSTGRTSAPNINQQYGMLSYSTPLPVTSAGDQIFHGFLLAAGTYDFKVLGATSNDFGIATYYIDNVSIGTLDWYSLSQTLNQVKTISSISVPADGWHELKIAMLTKNGSSAGYGYLTTHHTIKKP